MTDRGAAPSLPLRPPHQSHTRTPAALIYNTCGPQEAKSALDTDRRCHLNVDRHGGAVKLLGLGGGREGHEGHGHDAVAERHGGGDAVLLRRRQETELGLRRSTLA